MKAEFSHTVQLFKKMGAGKRPMQTAAKNVMIFELPEKLDECIVLSC